MILRPKNVGRSFDFDLHSFDVASSSSFLSCRPFAVLFLSHHIRRRHCLLIHHCLPSFSLLFVPCVFPPCAFYAALSLVSFRLWLPFALALPVFVLPCSYDPPRRCDLSSRHFQCFCPLVVHRINPGPLIYQKNWQAPALGRRDLVLSYRCCFRHPRYHFLRSLYQPNVSATYNFLHDLP